MQQSKEEQNVHGPCRWDEDWSMEKLRQTEGDEEKQATINVQRQEKDILIAFVQHNKIIFLRLKCTEEENK